MSRLPAKGPRFILLPFLTAIWANITSNWLQELYSKAALVDHEALAGC
jgi:hypothetical protein